MKLPDTPPAATGIRTGRAFALLALAFVMTFGIVVLLLAQDQRLVVDTTLRLQDRTLPEIIRYQRLSRNLEQIRQEGERIFAVGTLPARQQALFVVTLVASHPSVLEHQEAARLARDVERFLAETVRTYGASDIPPAAYDEWQRFAGRLGVLVDDIYIQGVNQAGTDLKEVMGTMDLARSKLYMALLVVGIFLLIFLLLLHRHLIRPLQRIDEELTTLAVDNSRPHFTPTRMVEIASIEAAIVALHEALQRNEEGRRTLESLANRDGLTGLMNRRHFMETATVELERAHRYGRPITVGMADLDFFKRLNDTYGHAAGDQVLREFARLIMESVRQSDLVCRYGGEEFAFLFPESSLEEARLLAERLRTRCAAYDIRLPDDQLVRITVSIGLADATTSSIDDALRAADNALYAAKRLGRNRVQCVSGDLLGRPEQASPDDTGVQQAE